MSVSFQRIHHTSHIRFQLPSCHIVQVLPLPLEVRQFSCGIAAVAPPHRVPSSVASAARLADKCSNNVAGFPGSRAMRNVRSACGAQSRSPPQRTSKLPGFLTYLSSTTQTREQQHRGGKRADRDTCSIPCARVHDSFGAPILAR
jgi:hypothetical protein